MNIFGIGTFELLLVFLIAFLLLGPKKISQFARDFGKFVRKFDSQKKELNNLIENDFSEEIPKNNNEKS